MKLSAAKVKSLKPAAKAQKHYDGQGLHLYLTPSGGKLWRLDYRFLGRPKMLSLGAYPALGLAEARAARDAAKALLARNLDPSEERQKAKAEAFRRGDSDLWRVVAKEWRDKREREGADPVTLKKHDWLIGMTLPKLGSRRIGSITAPDLLDVLREVEAKGHIHTAGRLRSLAGRVFRYGIATARCERDVAHDLRDALTAESAEHHSALFDPEDVGALMRGIRAHGGVPPTRYGLLLCAYTFLRPGEVRGLRWSEIDLEAGQIVILGKEQGQKHKRMKSRRKHIVPMSPQVREILAEAKRWSCSSELVLPGKLAGDRKQSENTYNNRLRAILPEVGLAADSHVAHGFRRTASTTLHEMGWPSDWIEAQLAHKLGGVRGVYNAAEYLDDRRRMMSWYAHWLDCAALGVAIDIASERPTDRMTA